MSMSIFKRILLAGSFTLILVMNSVVVLGTPDEGIEPTSIPPVVEKF